ncbi:hypothetical protein ACFE04_029447 [Oxalis oulophora]
MESTGVASKLKPCTKFFSTGGCPFGDNCHFLHHFPGGYHAVAQIMNLPTHIPYATRNMPPGPPPSIQNGSGSNAVKSRICKRFTTMEGCKFGDQCNFAHGEWEMGKPVDHSYDDRHQMGYHMPGQMPGHHMPGHHMTNQMDPSATGFGVSATAKISVDANLVGGIIGKGGIHSKQICRETGVKLAIRENESDPKLKNIELEGTLDQIDQASAMVKELIRNLGPTAGSGFSGGKSRGPPQPKGSGHQPRTNFKTKLCENFTNGACTFGDRCHFAHGATEMRKTAVE